jgi:hypothetical protein
MARKRGIFLDCAVLKKQYITQVLSTRQISCKEVVVKKIKSDKVDPNKEYHVEYMVPLSVIVRGGEVIAVNLYGGAIEATGKVFDENYKEIIGKAAKAAKQVSDTESWPAWEHQG